MKIKNNLGPVGILYVLVRLSQLYCKVRKVPAYLIIILTLSVMNVGTASADNQCPANMEVRCSCSKVNGGNRTTGVPVAQWQDCGNLCGGALWEDDFWIACCDDTHCEYGGGWNGKMADDKEWFHYRP